MKYPSGKVVTKSDRTEATARLKKWLKKDGDTLWFILRNRSTSGMMRVYDVKELTIESSDPAEGETHGKWSVRCSTLSWNIAVACNYGWSETHGGVKIPGCGFSGEQEITDTVSRLLGIKLRYETL